MKMYNSLDEAIKENPNSYVSHSQIGDCMVCNKNHELRMGVCFKCSEKVSGEPIKNTKGEIKGHWLWEVENPKNRWITG